MQTAFSHTASITGRLLIVKSNLLRLFKLLRIKSMNVFDRIQAFAATAISMVWVVWPKLELISQISETIGLIISSTAKVPSAHVVSKTRPRPIIYYAALATAIFAEYTSARYPKLQILMYLFYLNIILQIFFSTEAKHTIVSVMISF